MTYGLPRWVILDEFDQPINVSEPGDTSDATRKKFLLDAKRAGFKNVTLAQILPVNLESLEINVPEPVDN